MPPPVSPVQGSRTGVVTALIIAIIVAVAMIVVGVYEGQQASRAAQDKADLEKKLAPVVSENDLTDPRVTALMAAKDQDRFQGASNALNVSLMASDQLARATVGDMPPDKAADAAHTQVKDAASQIEALKAKHLLEATFRIDPNASLASALGTMTADVAQLAASNKEKQDQLAAAQQKLQSDINARNELTKQKDEEVAKANTRAEQAEAEAKRYQEEAAANAQAIQASGNTGLQKEQQVVAALNAQLQARDKLIKTLQNDNVGLKSKLHLNRVNPNEPIVQHADGTIIRVTDNNTAFINLGSRQSVTKGLTFEVYDKNKGIPPLGDGLSDQNMPVGKASIEVFNVGPDTSECRVVKTQTGEQLVIGDPIVNLVYDPEVHYNFVVYGDFDLSNSGIASPGDAEIIKRLITQWGGRLQNDVNVDTDFVVMGKEPQLPAVADQTDPQKQIEYNRIKQRLEAYQAIIAKSAQLTVPIMNQNRFLYFIGYYDQARR